MHVYSLGFYEEYSSSAFVRICLPEQEINCQLFNEFKPSLSLQDSHEYIK